MSKVLILSEVKQRELLAATLLSNALKDLGHDVRIVGSHLFPTYHIDKYKPDLILNNGMRITRDYLRFIKYPKVKYGTKIATLYAEQISADSFSMEFYDHAAVLRDTDFHLTWGKAFAGKLLDTGNVFRENIYMVGSHRLDVANILRNSTCKDDYAKKYGLDPKKSWVLIASNIIVSKARDFKLIEYTNRAIQGFIKGMQLLTGTLKEVEFIYRPHPATPQLDMEERAFRNLKNVHFIGEEALPVWLSMADIMLVWQSTSAIDAWAAHVPVIAFEPVDTPHEFEPWHMKYVTRAKNMDELVNLVNRAIHDKALQEDPSLLNAREEFLGYWYGKLDTRSFIRTAYTLNRLMKIDTSRFSGKMDCKMALEKLKWSGIELYKGLRDILRGEDAYIWRHADIAYADALLKETNEMPCCIEYEPIFKMTEYGWEVILN